MNEHVDNLLEMLGTVLNDREEYETEHEDAGSNYLHLPSEGGWLYTNASDRLKVHLQEHELASDEFINDPGFMERLENQLLRFHMDCRPSTMYGAMPSDCFVIDSYPLEELEIEIDLNWFVPRYGTLSSVKRVFRYIRDNSHDYCMTYHDKDDTALFYICTDAVWLAIFDNESISDVVKELAGVEA